MQNSSLLHPARLREYVHRHSDYLAATPFPHAVIDGFFPAEVLRDVLDEIPERTMLNGCISGAAACYRKSGVHYRKSELHHDGMGPHTRALFSLLRSARFVRFLEELSSIERLVPDPAYEGSGLHITGDGGMLKVHHDFNFMQCARAAGTPLFEQCLRPDAILKERAMKRQLKGSQSVAAIPIRDVRLHRRVNVFVYLNPDWHDRYGGHLELWNRNMSSCERRILPSLGRLVVFSSSDFSYHGHPMPMSLPEGRSRRSAALYYYTHDRPEAECEQADCSTFRNAIWKDLVGCQSCAQCAAPRRRAAAPAA